MNIPRIDPTLGYLKFIRASGVKRNISPIFLAIYNGKIEPAKQMVQNDLIRNEFEDTINVIILYNRFLFT